MQDPQHTRKPSQLASPGALLWLALGAVLVRLGFQLITRVTFEDSLISLRYAENLAAGLGMVYNQGERVFGASTPLYVLFLAALTRLGLPALAIAKGCAALADGITLYLWLGWFQRRVGNPRAVAAFALLFGLAPLMVHVSVSGMETSFALLLLSIALIADLEDRPARCGAAFGLLMLVRPDGALAATVSLGLRWGRTRKFPLIPVLIATGIVLPWIITAWWYYGSPIPHSIPAKAAAYNLHRPSIMPSVRGTLAQFVPSYGTPAQLIAVLALCPLLIAGMVGAFRDSRLRTVAVLFLTWWAYLVLPRTLIFAWYFPLLLLPAYVMAGLGVDALERKTAFAKLRWLPGHTRITLGLLSFGLVCWLGWAGYGARRIQRAEESVRKAIGIWLRNHTPADARVALEPIGYIGYYSQRTILDEVGLVSPEMVPLNRAGRGWFSDMHRRLHPDYIVERPFYLLKNRTLNSGVPMFRDSAEREAFAAEYEPVKEFENADVPKTLRPDYRFVIFRRRTDAARREWELRWKGLSPAQRDELVIGTMTGPTVRPPAQDAPGVAPAPR